VPEPRGIFGGGQIGYNWQLPNKVVLGLEAAGGAGPGFNDQVSLLGASLKSEGRWYAMVGGRVGYAAGPFLPYIAGGVAWAGNHISASSAFGTSEIDNTHLGFHVGGGIEYALTRNISIGAEYRYFEFDKRTYGNVQTGSQVSTATGRVNFRF
jgi:outer membrane immunogenic protein